MVNAPVAEDRPSNTAFDDSQSGTTRSAARPAAPSDAPPRMTEDDVLVRYLVERFVERSDRSLNVCGTLSETPTSPPRDRATLVNALREQATQNRAMNPYVESSLALLAAVLTRPSVASVVQRILDANAANDPSRLASADFQGRVSAANADLVTRRSELETIAVASYHLYVIARAVTNDPTLINDGTTLDLCTRNQNLATDPSRLASRPEPERRAIMDRERANLLNWLSATGMAPAQVGYEPSAVPRVTFQVNGQRIAVDAAWMGRAFGTSPALVNPTPEVR